MYIEIKILQWEKIILLLNDQKESYEKTKTSYIFKKSSNISILMMKIIKKVNSHCHYTGKYKDIAHFICNIRYSVPNEIHVAFHNGFNFDYHFIIKKIVIEFTVDFNCYGKNTKRT